MSEFKKLDRIPSSDAEIRILIAPLVEATIEYNDIIMENTQESIKAGMERTKTELKRQGLGKSFESNMRFILNGSLKGPIPIAADIDFEEYSQEVSDRMKHDTFIASQGTIDRMSGDVMNNIKDSYEQGYGIDKAAVNLQDAFDGMEDWELKRVARTEINGAQNLGAQATMRQLGIQYCMWRTAGDARVRGNRPEDSADHKYLDGQITKAWDGRFSNGLTRPGDRNGPIKEWIQCRCVLLPYLMPEGYAAPSMSFFYVSDLIKVDIPKPEPKPKPGMKPKPRPRQEILLPKEDQMKSGNILRENFAKTHQDNYIRLDMMTDEKKLLNKEFDKMWKARPKFGTKEYKIWSKEYEAMIRKMDVNIRGKAAIRNVIKEDLREKLIINKEGYPISNRIDERFPQMSTNKINKALDQISTIVDKEVWPERSTLCVERLKDGGRAYQTSNSVFVTSTDSAKTIVHEAGHYIEGNSPGVHAKIQAFYDMRTAGETAKHLGRGYRPDEFFKKDKFIDNYMGKVYDDATEVLSMGLEYIYNDPMKLMTKDPEMFDFIIDIIRGIK